MTFSICCAVENGRPEFRVVSDDSQEEALDLFDNKVALNVHANDELHLYVTREPPQCQVND